MQDGALRERKVKSDTQWRGVDCAMRLPARSSGFDRFFVANDLELLGLGVDVDFYLRAREDVACS